MPLLTAGPGLLGAAPSDMCSPELTLWRGDKLPCLEEPLSAPEGRAIEVVARAADAGVLTPAAALRYEV